MIYNKELLMRENLLFCTEKIVARITIWLKRSCMLRVGELKSATLVELDFNWDKNLATDLENVFEHMFFLSKLATHSILISRR